MIKGECAARAAFLLPPSPRRALASFHHHIDRRCLLVIPPAGTPSCRPLSGRTRMMEGAAPPASTSVGAGSDGAAASSDSESSAGAREGTRPGFFVTDAYTFPPELPATASEKAREAREGGGISLPAALAACFPDAFPSMSSARKRVRRGEVAPRPMHAPLFMLPSPLFRTPSKKTGTNPPPTHHLIKRASSHGIVIALSSPSLHRPPSRCSPTRPADSSSCPLLPRSVEAKTYSSNNAFSLDNTPR